MCLKVTKGPQRRGLCSTEQLFWPRKFLMGQKTLSKLVFFGDGLHDAKTINFKSEFNSIPKYSGPKSLIYETQASTLRSFCPFETYFATPHFWATFFLAWLSKTFKEADPHFSSTSDVISLHCTTQATTILVQEYYVQPIECVWQCFGLIYIARNRQIASRGVQTLKERFF